MHTYLTSLNGPQRGTSFPLDPAVETVLGRDATSCHIVAADVRCSRVHARLAMIDGAWWIRDAESRNGTFVDDRKVDDARLVDGCVLRLGAAEFGFHQTNGPPPEMGVPNPSVHQTLEGLEPPTAEPEQDLSPLTFLADAEGHQDFLVLYQLCLQMVACPDPDEVVGVALAVLREMTGAAVAAFLWTDAGGHLQVKRVVPAEASLRIIVHDSLAAIGRSRTRAVWMNDPDAEFRPEALARLPDAICVALLHGGHPAGMIHLYRDGGRFQPKDFQFTRTLTRIVAAALVRAWHQAALQADLRRLVDKTADFEALLGDSAVMRSLKDKILRVAKASGCLLIRGESGVGKELVARAVHRHGPRAERPLLSVNCAAIPRDLLESHLFGHKKGAFTGADADHSGLFEQADTGTLFLDEVGELTLEGQAKLLRILDGHPFLPVGSSKERRVDVRVIAATNRDLREFIREKRFREDLFYRLTVFELALPPLRERGTDIGLLIDHFLDHFKRAHGRPTLTLSAAARQLLLAYNWPGNVRQLRNVLDSAVVLAGGDEIQPSDLGLSDVREDAYDTLRIEDWERRLIREALNRTGENVPEAAKLLGIGRATLYRKLDEYGIARGPHRPA